MELVEGSIVANRFQLTRMLGRGGMGSVWHATHLGLDIPCAVKFIDGEFASLPEAQARFEREAKAAAQLRSPHVVQILDHGISEGRPYIAMELLDGEDLGKRLARVGRLAATETAVVMTQVCRALTKAHSLGVVHRDLKPDNIFLVRDDDREIAKVLDFGIAKSNATGIDGSNTKTGAMLGTPYYMSPEQAQGTKAVDYRSDLWSLAIIAFQCVTGRLPFESEALGDLLVKIIVAEMPIPSAYGPVPPAFDAWWARAAARDPSQRFQSAKEFADTLNGVLNQSAMTDVMSERSVRAAMASAGDLRQQSHPFGMTPPSAMAQSVVAGSDQRAGGGSQGGWLPQGINATTGAPIARTYSGLVDAPLQAKKKKTGLVIVVAIALAGALGGLAIIVRRSPDKSPSEPKTLATQAMTAREPPTTDPAAKTVEPPQPVAVASVTPLASVTPPIASGEAPSAKKEDTRPSRRPTSGTPGTSATPGPTGTTGTKTSPKQKSDMEKKLDSFGF